MTVAANREPLDAIVATGATAPDVLRPNSSLGASDSSRPVPSSAMILILIGLEPG
jgi:hypothetical protein